MKVINMAIAGLALAVQLSPTTAGAAPKVAAVSIQATIQRFSPLITTLKFPAIGLIGDASLQTIGKLPGLSGIKLPVIGDLSGVPVVSNITVGEGAQILEAAIPIRRPLLGLGLLSSLVTKRR